jgi:hypothetical protein
VAALEALIVPSKRKVGTSAPRRGYENILQAESDKRWNLWITYFHLKTLEACGRVYNRARGDFLPTSRAWFAANVKDDAGQRFCPRELQRWFSPRSTFPVGSRQDLRIRGAVQREINRLRSLGYYLGMSEQEIDRLHAATVM